MKDSKTLGMVQVALFGAIIIIMAFTPYLGYIPLGVINATIIHIPVIIGSIILGPKKGALLGFVFGLTSLINNSWVHPNLTSFAFSPFYSLGEIHGNFLSLIVCFVPRILVGVFPFYVYKFLMKKFNNAAFSLSVAGLIGSLTNTLLVMNLIFLFFRNDYAVVKKIDVGAVYNFILTIIATNGIPEAIVASILTIAIGKALLKMKNKQTR